MCVAKHLKLGQKKYNQKMKSEIWLDTAVMMIALMMRVRLRVGDRVRHPTHGTGMVIERWGKFHACPICHAPSEAGSECCGTASITIYAHQIVIVRFADGEHAINQCWLDVVEQKRNGAARAMRKGQLTMLAVKAESAHPADSLPYGTRSRLARRLGVSAELVSQAMAVAQWAAELTGPVIAGAMALHAAYAQAKEREAAARAETFAEHADGVGTTPPGLLVVDGSGAHAGILTNTMTQ